MGRLREDYGKTTRRLRPARIPSKFRESSGQIRQEGKTMGRLWEDYEKTMAR